MQTPSSSRSGGPETFGWVLAVLGVLRLCWGVVQRIALKSVPAVRGPLPAELSRGQRYPSVSIVIPARNEAATIAACLEGALAQDYPGLEIVVVDDRSEDETAEIVRRFRARAGEDRLHLLAGRPLEPGWMGKPWALQQGAGIARGEWLLFVDADTRLLPGAVAGAIVEARRRGAAVLSALTAQELPTVWERIVQPAVFGAIGEAMPVVLVNSPRVPQVAVANGQFLLVRRDTYDALGGHEAIKAEIAEDAEFARRTKVMGWRYWLGDGRELAVTRMYTTPGGLWEGWTKNLHAGYKSLPWVVPLGVLYLLVVFVAPYVGLVVAQRRRSTSLLIASALQMGTLLLIRRLTDQTFDVPARYTLAQPLGQAVFLALVGSSFYKVITGRGVTWKGRRYHSASAGTALPGAVSDVAPSATDGRPVGPVSA